MDIIAFAARLEPATDDALALAARANGDPAGIDVGGVDGVEAGGHEGVEQFERTILAYGPAEDISAEDQRGGFETAVAEGGRFCMERLQFKKPWTYARRAGPKPQSARLSGKELKFRGCVLDRFAFAATQGIINGLLDRPFIGRLRQDADCAGHAPTHHPGVGGHI